MAGRRRLQHLLVLVLLVSVGFFLSYCYRYNRSWKEKEKMFVLTTCLSSLLLLILLLLLLLFRLLPLLLLLLRWTVTNLLLYLQSTKRKDRRPLRPSIVVIALLRLLDLLPSHSSVVDAAAAGVGAVVLDTFTA